MNLTPEQSANLSPDHPIFRVMERMTKIEEGMLKNDPELPTHLRAIWKEMQTYEDLPHLLTPEQIGVLMRGMQKHTTIQLVTEDQGKKTKAKAAKPGVDDLI